MEDSKLLRYGPVGTGRIGEGNVLCILDGQTVKPNSEGILAIDDDRSPYNGMTVADYKAHLVLPWLTIHQPVYSIDRAYLPPWPEGVPRPDPPNEN